MYGLTDYTQIEKTKIHLAFFLYRIEKLSFVKLFTISICIRISVLRIS